MANNITVDLKDLFGGKMFRIPNYQRGYSWEERQLEDLWDDINQALYRYNIPISYKPV